MASDVDQLVQIEWPQPGVALLRLNRPDRLNALSPGMVAEIPEALTTVATDRACRVIILTGAGRGFCAGLDLQETTSSPDGFGRGPGRMLEGQERFASMIKTLRTLRQPVIAAVNGAAAGAGFALALGSDIRIAAQSARFHVAAVKLGLSGGECGMSYLLPRQIGSARALELLLTGRPFDAAEAERIGLVARRARRRVDRSRARDRSRDRGQQPARDVADQAGGVVEPRRVELRVGDRAREPHAGARVDEPRQRRGDARVRREAPAVFSGE